MQFKCGNTVIYQEDGTSGSIPSSGNQVYIRNGPTVAKDFDTCFAPPIDIEEVNTEPTTQVQIQFDKQACGDLGAYKIDNDQGGHTV